MKLTYYTNNTQKTKENGFKGNATQIRRKCDAFLTINGISGRIGFLDLGGKMDKKLELAIAEGEGLMVEFKERLANLDKEIVAFANTAGGVIYLGVDDEGKVVGIGIDNGLKSQVTDIAHNCDPSIKIQFEVFSKEKVLAVRVQKGLDKPYRCKDGFFIRNGPSSQKLKRDEIVALIIQGGNVRFDEAINERFNFPLDFSQESLDEYLRISGIATHASAKDILQSLNVAQIEQGELKFTNAGVLLFAKDPQKFFPESYITAIKYKTNERFSILDKKDFKGSLISQIEQTLAFVLRHMNVEPSIDMGGASPLGSRRDIYEYSLVAMREAVVNAVVHRDYIYDSSHIYVHMFTDYVEIENPGGLFRDLTLEDLGKRSVRRNRLIADLLHRSGFVERVGGGFSRMKTALAENNNPPLQVSVTNFFNIRFYKRVEKFVPASLTARQLRIYRLLAERGSLTKSEICNHINISEDTALRDLNKLIELGIAVKTGTGKATTYQPLNA